MKIWVTRHGQTNLNKKKLMQSFTDEPLNDTGRGQARKAAAMIGNVKFDAVYASPLCRAIETASIIGHVDRSEVITDPRITEVNFGRYELVYYLKQGIHMTMFWLLPEIIPAPKTVEAIPLLKKRSRSFLKELESKDYENVLVACHGGIMRVLCGYLEDKRSGLSWRPHPHNCEIRVYESDHGRHKKLATYRQKHS